MATARMRKIKIVGEKGDQKAILELLTRSGCFEICEAEKAMADTYKPGFEADAVKSKQAKVAFAIEYINSLKAEAETLNKRARKTVKKNELFDEMLFVEKTKSSFARLNMGSGDYVVVRNREAELLAVCEALEKNNIERLELHSKIQNLKDIKSQVIPFESLDISFSRFSDTKTAGVLLASGPVGSDKHGLEKKLDCYVEEYPSRDAALWGMLCKLEDKPAVERKLTNLGFTLCVFSYDKSARELIAEGEIETEEFERLSRQKLKEGLVYQNRFTELRALYDVLEIDLEHVAAEPYIYKTDLTVTIEGWTPEKAVNAIKSKLQEEIGKAHFESRTVEPDDEPPSMISNAKLVRPFESVTKGYSAPTYGEIDPSAVMSIFFFIFFGIMLADAGYGLMMAVIGLILGFFVKLETPLKRMILMFGICGISGIFFGLMFGGFFAIEGLPPLWFDPLEDPITMLVFSLGLGSVHLLTGYTLKSIGSIRTGFAPDLSKGTRVFRIIDGLFDSVFMYALFGGVLFLLLPMAFSGSGFPFTAVAIALIAIALTGILLTSGRKSKKLGGKIAGGLGGLYRLINVFSDVLSYARLFGLALASGAIAMAFNQIGMMLFDVPVAGYVLGVIALIVLHIFNFALSALAAYVHNIRLQYVEFFGKFYDGNGRFFTPLGENTKYVRFVESAKSKL